jgi:prevent-host-death family protein
MKASSASLGPNQKGAIAEAAVTLAATRLGFGVLKPVAEHSAYDLALDLGSEIVRVQCKWARSDGEVVEVYSGRCRAVRGGYIRQTYDVDEIDALAAYCERNGATYLLPASLVAGKRLIRLRLTPPKNGQRAAIRWASAYEFGAVAQLGERRHGMAEVRGSSPLSSTPSESDANVSVGAHAFRERFGFYMEQAAAGTDVHVTRHGRPSVRLTASEAGSL